MLLWAVILLLPLSLSAQEAVKLEWLPMPEAKKYQVEIALQKNKDIPLVSQELDSPAITVLLNAAPYSYRVRAILDGNVAGPWSDYLDFSVNASTLKLLEPKNLADITATKLARTVKLAWEPGSADNKYRIQISGPAGVKETEVNSTVFEWKPPAVGTYTWRVGFSNGTNEIWSESSTIVIRGEKIPVETQVKLAGTPKEPGNQSVELREAVKPSRNSFDFMAWVGPVYTSYSGRYVDQSNSSTATTLSEIYGLSVLLRRNEGTKPLGAVAGAELSIKRQFMLHKTVILPTAVASGGYYWNSGDWNTGVFAGVGIKTLGLFIIDGFGQYSSDNVSRLSTSVGVRTNKEISPRLSLGIGIAGGIDTGGSSNLITGSFEPAPTAEFIVSSRLLRNNRNWNLNLSFKNEILKWASSSGLPSSFSTTMATLSLGTNL